MAFKMASLILENSNGRPFEDDPKPGALVSRVKALEARTDRLESNQDVMFHQIANMEANLWNLGIILLD
ncbi:unnamed protein product [Penicillium pancosmium]